MLENYGRCALAHNIVPRAGKDQKALSGFGQVHIQNMTKGSNEQKVLGEFIIQVIYKIFYEKSYIQVIGTV